MKTDRKFTDRLAERIVRAERVIVCGRDCVRRTNTRVQETLFVLRMSQEMRARTDDAVRAALSKFKKADTERSSLAGK